MCGGVPGFRRSPFLPLASVGLLGKCAQRLKCLESCWPMMKRDLPPGLAGEGGRGIRSCPPARDGSEKSPELQAGPQKAWELQVLLLV